MKPNACPRTVKPFKLYTSIVGILLMLGVGQAATPEAEISPQSDIKGMFQQQLRNLSESALGTESQNPSDNPQFATIKDLPDFSEKNIRVGLQVGHWQNDNPPAELSWIKRNTGANGGGKWESEIALDIVNHAKDILERQGIAVDIIPAVVPPGYRADVFVSVHADGSDKNPNASGYKIAPSARDQSGQAGNLFQAVSAAYAEETHMRWDNNITTNMTHYYSFADHKYTHSISPETPAILLETGFLTNSADRYFLVDHPEIPGRGLAYGIVDYLVQAGK